MPEERQEPVTGENPAEAASPREEVMQLRDAIARLEEIATQLTQKPEVSLPDSAFQVLSASVEGLSTALETPEDYREMEVRAKSEAEAVPVTEVISPEEFSQEPAPTADEDLLSWETLQDAWDWVLEKIRDLLPEPVEERLSDGALTGILGGLIAAILVGTIALSGGEKPAPVAQVPEVVEPAIEQPEKPIEKPVEKPKKAIEELPPEVTAPEPPKPVVTPQPKPFALPFSRPKLTPEQSLIAAIQEQVAEITDRYADGLISSIQANFFSGSLTVTVSGEWYILEQAQQNELANEVLGRSKQLDFTKIKILDEQGMMVARSPVVGQEMVIFQRTQPETIL